jgi:hypothetical protein
LALGDTLGYCNGRAESFWATNTGNIGAFLDIGNPTNPPIPKNENEELREKIDAGVDRAA